MILIVFEKNIFKYFSGALSYYQESLNLFIKNKPSLAVFCADGYESYLISAHAAKKAKIKTAFIPHGLYTWGYQKIKYGRFSIFDYLFSTGSADTISWTKNSSKEKIINSPPIYLDKNILINKKNLRRKAIVKHCYLHLILTINGFQIISDLR